MKRILFLIFLPAFSFAQNTIGLPDIINYSKQSYNAGLQNWDIKQDRNGIIYFANNEGLLSFDGRVWRLYPLPNHTIVRSIEIAADGRIYAGGQDELGYFSPAANGKLTYKSLINLIPNSERSFGDVWDIVSTGSEVIFRSPSKLYRLSNNVIKTYRADVEWAFLGMCDGRIYAQDYARGLLRLEGNDWLPIGGKNALPAYDPITAILSIGRGKAIIASLKNGLFEYDGVDISKHKSTNNKLFAANRIYAATHVNNDWFALATSNNGVYIIDANGNVIQSFSRTEGIQNNNVLSIFLDNQSNLWLGLDNGIDFIAYNSAIKKINPFIQDGSGYTSLIHNNSLYVGTSNGLYTVPLQNTEDLSFSKGTFSLVNNTSGQTWSLADINGRLLLGHHEGAFIISNNTALPFSINKGFWNFTAMPGGQLVAGNYNGLMFFDDKGATLKMSGSVPGFSESSRFVVTDEGGRIWVSHPYHGLFRVRKNGNGHPMTEQFTEKDGLPSTLNNHVYKIGNQICVATSKGIFVYNTNKAKFERSKYYYDILGDQSIRYLKQDRSGNTWFIHEKDLGVIDVSGRKPQIIYLPELSSKLLSGFEFIYPVNESNIFLGGEKGFFHINFNKYKKNVPKPGVQVRTVRIIDQGDSLLFGGYFKSVNQKQIQATDKIPEISNNFKTIRFEFSSSLFEYQSNLQYSFRLKGYEEKWSEWGKRTDKEYTNLPAGNYIFEVKIKNNLQNVSETAFFAFKVLPPWYLNNWAKGFYLIVFVLFNYLLYRWLKHKFEMQRQKHEEEQARLRYIHELERNKAENELVALGHEKLEAEINFKNSELASSAMHLVKKAELISKIKGKLGHVMKELDNPEVTSELKGIIRALNEDDNLDKEWENFSKHFDKVQSDFLNELKERHPAITGNELKLCAYLRMNLSTKEIAQLTNISVRGVEIGRYRLRKKLQVPTETNLFDYLISLNGNVKEEA